MNTINERLTTFSVIIPFYNVEKYLQECLLSVKNQTYTDFEVIMIDDGSTDKSKTIAKSFLKDTRFSLYSQLNQGQGHARNKGMELSKGEFIYFMDSDDIMDSRLLEYIHNCQLENDFELCQFSGSIFGAEAKEFQFNYSKKNTNNIYGTGSSVFRKLISSNEYSCQPCLMVIKSQFLKENDIKFPVGFIHEDEFFSFELFLHANKVLIKDKVLFHRRVRNNSTMTGRSAIKHLIGYCKNVILMNEKIEEVNLSDEDRDLFINRIGTMFKNNLKYRVDIDSKEINNNTELKELVEKADKCASSYNFFDSFTNKLFFKWPQLYKLMREIKKQTRS